MDEEIWRYSFGRSVMGLYSYGVFSNRSFNRFMRSTYASISTSIAERFPDFNTNPSGSKVSIETSSTL